MDRGCELELRDGGRQQINVIRYGACATAPRPVCYSFTLVSHSGSKRMESIQYTASLPVAWLITRR